MSFIRSNKGLLDDYDGIKVENQQQHGTEQPGVHKPEWAQQLPRGLGQLLSPAWRFQFIPEWGPGMPTSNKLSGNTNGYLRQAGHFQNHHTRRQPWYIGQWFTTLAFHEVSQRKFSKFLPFPSHPHSQVAQNLEGKLLALICLKKKAAEVAQFLGP